jgi:hypothetical protein
MREFRDRIRSQYEIENFMFQAGNYLAEFTFFLIPLCARRKSCGASFHNGAKIDEEAAIAI